VGILIAQLRYEKCHGHYLLIRHDTQVLAGFPNLQDNIYSLYVTDYTCNKDLHPVQAKWCPASMATLVLKIEMWDSAATLGRSMEKGSFYHIRNARMKRSHSDWLEGKVVEQKITKLEERDSETNLYLKNLLECAPFFMYFAILFTHHFLGGNKRWRRLKIPLPSSNIA
jgi:hypothetical protein